MHMQRLEAVRNGDMGAGLLAGRVLQASALRLGELSTSSLSRRSRREIAQQRAPEYLRIEETIESVGERPRPVLEAGGDGDGGAWSQPN